MSERKQTPDILAEILGGPAELPELEGVAGPQAHLTVRKAKGSAPAKTKSAVQHTRPISKTVDIQAPQHWEHRVVSFQAHKGWRLRFVDGVEIDDWMHAMTICEYLAHVSLDGWQVAGACTGQAMFGLLDKYQIYLKRCA